MVENFLKSIFKNKEIETALAAVAKQPENILKLEVLANLYFKNNFYKEAVSIYEKILRLDENYIVVMPNLAQSYLNLKSYFKAFVTLKYLYKQTPYDEKIRELIFSFYDNNMPNEEKIQILSGLLELDNQNIDVYKKLADSYEKTGQFTKCILTLERLLDIETKSEYLKRLAYLYIKVKNIDEAIQMFEQLLVLNEFSLNDVKILASLYAKKKNFQAAKDLLELLIENLPNEKKELQLELSKIYMLEQNNEKAVEQAQETIEENEFYEDAKFLKIDALVAEKNYKEALEFLQEFYYDPVNKETEKKIVSLITQISIEYARETKENGEYSRAIDCLTPALRHDSNNKDIYYMLAEISEAIKDYSSAKEYLKIAKELEE